MSEKKEKNYWPHGIVAILMGVVVLIIYTINFATNAKVQDEIAFFQDHHAVDLNINEIQIAQAEFEKKYSFMPLTQKLEMGENTLRFKVLNNDSEAVSQIGAKILLTRPHTNVDNQDLDMDSLNQGIVTTNAFNIAKKGRWKVQYFIQVGEDKGYFSQDINTSM